jgi:hypothetical protein
VAVRELAIHGFSFSEMNERFRALDWQTGAKKRLCERE